MEEIALVTKQRFPEVSLDKVSNSGGPGGKAVIREGLISRFFRMALRWNYPLEGREILGFLYFFLVITSYYIIKPIRASRFLTDIGAENIPYFYLLNSFLVFLVVYGYNFIVDLFRGNKRRFFFVVNGFLALNVLGFAFLFMMAQIGAVAATSIVPTTGQTISAGNIFQILYPLFEPFVKGKRLTVVFFIWASFFAVFVVSVFWSLMSELFTSEEGKRSYAFIGLGGVLGGAVGGKLAEVFAQPLGETWLLVLSAGILGACTLMTGPLLDDSKKPLLSVEGDALGREDPHGGIMPDESGSVAGLLVKERAKSGKELGALQGLSLILGDGYVRSIAFIVMFMTMAGTIFDFQLNTICQTSIHERFGFADLMGEVAAGLGGNLGILNERGLDKLRSAGVFRAIDAEIQVSVNRALAGERNSGIPGRNAVDGAVIAAFRDAWVGNVSKFAGPGFITFGSDVELALKNGLKNTTTAFFGWVYGTVSQVSFMVQLFLTARLQQTFGISVSLLVLPAVCLPGLLILFAAPVLIVISLLTVIQNGLSYSLMQSTREQLYIPVSDEVRYKAKPFIDTFIFRFGDALACLAILIGTGPARLGLTGLTVVNSVFVLIWGVSVRYCGTRYTEITSNIKLSTD